MEAHPIGGEDYEELSVEVPLRFGVGRRCVGISILEDSEYEENEMFQVVIEDLRISTQVAILDDGKYNYVPTCICLPPIHAIFF